MIKNIKHKGLKKFFETGSTKGIHPEHTNRLRLRLAVLDNAVTLDDIAAHHWGLHPLSGNKADQYAIRVTGNWRLFFKFENGNVFLLDYDDYH
jgi:proteic killer suppression protein